MPSDKSRIDLEFRDGVSGCGGRWKVVPIRGIAGVGAEGEATAASIISISSTLSFPGSCFVSDFCVTGAVGVF